MGRQRTPGLEWLDPENTDQRQWARDYLLLKGRTQHFEYREGIQPDTPYTHEEMLQIGRKIEQEKKDDAYKLFQGMKDAWRQERSRQRKKETGHQACLFILKGDIKDNLKIMAKELDTDATALLEKLIARAYKAHQKKKNQKQGKLTEQTQQGNGMNSLEELKEALTGGTSQPNPPSKQDAPLAENSTDPDSPLDQPIAMMGDGISEPYLAHDLAQTHDVARKMPKKKKKYTIPDKRQAKLPSKD